VTLFSDLSAQSQNSAFVLPHEEKRIKAAMFLDRRTCFRLSQRAAACRQLLQLQADKLIFIASMAAVKRANDTPSLFEQDIGALLEADDALEDDDDEFEEITESDYVY